MNATGTQTPATASSLPACERYVVKTASTVCEVRARTIAPIAEVLGFEAEMVLSADGVVDPASPAGWDADGGMIADLLESRMIAPPRLRRRRQRTVSSRAVFFGTLDR